MKQKALLFSSSPLLPSSPVAGALRVPFNSASEAAGTLEGEEPFLTLLHSKQMQSTLVFLL